MVMSIKRFKYLLLGICALMLCAACEEKIVPERYYLAPELVAHEAIVSGNTATIRVDDLSGYVTLYYDGEYGLELYDSQDMSTCVASIVLYSIYSKEESSEVNKHYDYSKGQWEVDIYNLEDEATYYYCVYITKRGVYLRSEMKSFTVTRVGINSLEDLIAFRDAVNSGGDEAAFVKDKVVHLHTDIDLGSVGDWEPIAKNDLTFNGNGHTIKNMTVNASDADGHYGFFANNYGVIKNLNIGEGCHIRKSADAVTAACGGVCGYCGSYASISYCMNEATIEGSTAGGIVGHAYVGCKLTNNVNNGAVSGTECSGGIAGKVVGKSELVSNINTGAVTGVLSGGIVGYFPTSPTASSRSTVEQNINEGAVDGTDYAGGIAGSVRNVDLNDNVSSGAVTGPEGSVGGIAGQVKESTLSRNINNGTVNGEAGTEENETGTPGIRSLEELIVFRDARNRGESVAEYKNAQGVITLYTDIDMGSVENWTPIKSIEWGETFNGNGHTITNMKISAVKDYDYYGFVSINRGSISNLNIGSGCEVDIEGTSKETSVGAICGYCGNGSLVSNCTNAAVVKGPGKTGGIAGGVSDSGTLSGNINDGAVGGASYTGGIAGWVHSYGVICDNTNNGVVSGASCTGGIAGGMDSESHCTGNTNNGEVEGSDRKTTGGIAGYVAGTVECEGNENKGAVGGEAGSEENAYGRPGIYSLDDLVAFRDAHNQGGEVSLYRDMRNVINLYADIDMSGIEDWTPIYTIESSETFNGNGHTITNMKIGNEDGTDKGFIGNNYGTVMDLHIGSGCQVPTKPNSTSQYDVYYGGICGRCFSGSSIKSCTNAARVIGYWGNYAGGITGAAEKNVTLVGNINYGDINGGIIGGIVGYVQESTMIEDNVNNGIINGGTYVGGIVGIIENNACLKANVNNGSATATAGEDGATAVGGIAGDVLWGSILEDNVNRGAVTGYVLLDYTSGTGITTRGMPQDGSAGGIAGRVRSSTLRRNINSGAVTGKFGVIGGVAGDVNGSVLEENANTGTVNGEASSTENEVGTIN